MADPTPWTTAVRRSHDRFAGLVSPLSEAQVRAGSYDDDWSIADVASHLGSQAEIFTLFLQAGLDGTAAPAGEVFGPIWDRWNAASPTAQVTDSVAANEAFVTRVEQLTPVQREAFALAAFGTDLDLAGMLALRLGEHALHTWDVAVALDPSATLAPDAVDLLVDTLPGTAARAGTPVDGIGTTTIHTSGPERTFTLTVAADVTLVAAETPADTVHDSAVQLPAEALVRLLYGRLDPGHTPADIAQDPRLPGLRTVFPGF